MNTCAASYQNKSNSTYSTTTGTRWASAHISS
jgi:hypothetical protein